MDLSIVIPTYNRLESLKQVLRGLADQQNIAGTDIEIIVVSDGSTDGTDQYLHAQNILPTVKPLLLKNTGAAAARNAGIEAAVGEYVLLLDDDVVPTPQLIAEHLRIHAEHGESAVALGPMLSPPGFAMSRWVEWEQMMLAKQYHAMVNGEWEPTARQFFTGNTSLSRRAIVDAGGFDTKFRRAEDLELAYRLADQGLKFHFNPQAIGYHYAVRSLAAWMAIPYEYGVNDVIFAREKGQNWILPTVWREYGGRNRAIRILTHVCLDRRLAAMSAVSALKALILFGPKSLAQVACSGLFNFRYYQGISDQLGGRGNFFAGLDNLNSRAAADEHSLEYGNSLQ